MATDPTSMSLLSRAVSCVGWPVRLSILGAMALTCTGSVEPLLDVRERQIAELAAELRRVEAELAKQRKPSPSSSVGSDRVH